MLPIQRLATVDADFLSKLKTLLAFEAAADENIERTVANILADVKTRGDAAVIEYTNRFDGMSAQDFAELELTQKKIRQCENRSKMLDRRLAIEKRKERNHRLCSRGGFIESIVPELITMTDEDAQTFFRLALTSEPAREFLRKRAEETTS